MTVRKHHQGPLSERRRNRKASNCAWSSSIFFGLMRLAGPHRIWLQRGKSLDQFHHKFGRSAQLIPIPAVAVAEMNALAHRRT